MSSYLAFGGCSHNQIDPFDPADANIWRKAEYLGRYLFAADFLRQYHPSVVADISCGRGYGTRELCSIAKAVIGVDCSIEMIEAASKRIQNRNVSFIKKDLEYESLAPDISEESVDAVVSFETLEHLVDPMMALSQFHKAIRPAGHFICSVPNVLSESGDDAGLPRNKSHKQWFSFESLRRMVERQGFTVAYRLGQSRSKALFRREQQLSNAKRIPRRLSDETIMHSEEMMRWLSYVAAYPTVEDVDGSYSMIIVAQKI